MLRGRRPCNHSPPDRVEDDVTTIATTATPRVAPADRLALVAAGVTVVFWASAFVGIRALAGTFSPGSIALGRLAVAALALAPLVFRQGWTRMSRRDVVLVIASGLFWYAFYFVILNEAERHVDAGTASLVVNTGPIFLALFAGLFLGEGLPRRLLVGLAV